MTNKTPEIQIESGKAYKTVCGTLIEILQEFDSTDKRGGYHLFVGVELRRDCNFTTYFWKPDGECPNFPRGDELRIVSEWDDSYSTPTRYNPLQQALSTQPTTGGEWRELPFEQMNKVYDAARGILLGMSVGIYSFKGMREHLAEYGAEAPPYLSEGVGHITKSEQAQILWEVMFAEYRRQLPAAPNTALMKEPSEGEWVLADNEEEAALRAAHAAKGV